MSGVNPFTPTFGTSPPLLVGRDIDLDDFREGLRGGPGSPERATLVTGLRGTGKTVMLNAYEDVAGAEGWLVISETATPNLIDRITHEHLPRLLSEVDPRQTESRLTGVSLPGGLGADRELTLVNAIICFALVFGIGASRWTLGVVVLLATVGQWALGRVTRYDPDFRRVYTRHVQLQAFYPATSSIHAPRPIIHAAVPYSE